MRCDSLGAAPGLRERVTIFPHAQVEIFCHFGSRYETSPCLGAPLRPLAPATLFGPRFRPYEHLWGPHVDWFLVQLTPAGCRAILGVPFAALGGGDRPLVELCGEDGPRLAEQLAACTDFGRRCERALSWLRNRLGHTSAGDAAIAHLAERARDTAIPRAASLAEALGISDRWLRKRFLGELGVAPKTWLSVLRAERLWTSLHPSAPNRGSALLEFADESHANREFRRFTGLSPAQYQRIKEAGDGLVNGGERQRVYGEGDSGTVTELPVATR